MKPIFTIPVSGGIDPAVLEALEAAIAACAPKYQKDYLSIPIEWAIDGSSAPDATAALSSINSIMIRKFAGAGTNQDVFLPVLIPPDIEPATDKIQFRVHAFFTEAQLPLWSGVCFQLKGSAISPGNLLSKAPGDPIYLFGQQLTGSTTPWQPNYLYPGNGAFRPTVPNGFAYFMDASGAFYGGTVEPTWPTIIGAPGASLDLSSTTYHLITAYADYGATVPGAVLITSPGHNLDYVTPITIYGSTNYNGTFTPVEPQDENDDGDHFYITAPWVSDDGTGKFNNPGDALNLNLASLDYQQNSLYVTDWSTDLTIPDLPPQSTLMMLHFSRLQNQGGDTYNQKIGVAFIELRFVQEPAS